MSILSPSPVQATHVVHATRDAAISANVYNREFFSPLDRATQSFRQAMEALNYSPAYCREACLAIREHQETATLVELGLIDPDDESLLEAAFVDGFDAVHASSPQWNDASRWEVPVPTPEEFRAYAEMMGDFDPTDCTDDSAPLVPLELVEPSDTDWDEYHRWAVTLDASRPWEALEQELAEVGITR